MLFNIPFMFLFSFVFSFSILCILCFCTVFFIVSPFVHSCLSPTFVSVYRPLPPGGKPIAANKYHISHFVHARGDAVCRVVTSDYPTDWTTREAEINSRQSHNSVHLAGRSRMRTAIRHLHLNDHAVIQLLTFLFSTLSLSSWPGLNSFFCERLCFLRPTFWLTPSCHGGCPLTVQATCSGTLWN